MAATTESGRLLGHRLNDGGPGHIKGGLWLAVDLCLIVLVAGCGPRGPTVEMVEGVILLDGEPVEGATVFFSPAPTDGQPQGGLPAAGRTGTGGSFRLNAVGGARSGAGTKVGEYVVTVVKQESDAPVALDPNVPPAPPRLINVRDLLPSVYKVGATSPLRATVKQGRNVFRFELDSKAAAERP
ncbi:MAG: hypothetical protein ACKOEM_16155 [Planctomycetia bacterium]